MKSDRRERRSSFGELIELRFSEAERGRSRCALEVTDSLRNFDGTVHSGVICSLADTGMGGAVHSLMSQGDSCATVELKIVYLGAVSEGVIECETRVIKMGGRIAVLESEVRNNRVIVAKALGTFSISKKRP
jgi:uncharacterized protein (TIGR00369 family)